jgi:translation elongation factor aEF-1 beta
MAGAAVKIKIMPLSPSVSLEDIEAKATKIIEEEKGRIGKIEREPIAFGLNAIMILFAWDEDCDREALEERLRQIENVNSAEIVDFRRAFG